MARGLNIERQRGFTLIELLVALGVSAVIAVLAYQSINSMVNVKQSVEQHAKQTEKLQRAMWRMEQDFVQLVPRPILDELGSELPAFQYRQDTGLEFTRIAQYPTPNATGGLVRVSYQLEGEVLYRLTWPVLDRAQDTQPYKVALLDEIVSFEIELMNAQKSWVRDWPVRGQSNKALPVLSRLTLEHKELGKINRLFMGIN